MPEHTQEPARTTSPFDSASSGAGATLLGAGAGAAAGAALSGFGMIPGLGPIADLVASVMGHWGDQTELYPTTAPRARQTPGGREGVVYLGLNDESREGEAKTFEKMKHATVVEGNGPESEMQGKRMSKDGKTVLDLSKDEDVTRFLRESGVAALRTDADGNPLETPEQAQQRLQAMQEFFVGKEDENGVRRGGLPGDVRDEMAGFVNVLQSVEQGETRMDRLVISGHSFGDSVFSGVSDNNVEFSQFQTLMEQFPQARGGVEDLMLSACHTLEKYDGVDRRDGAQYKNIFPELSTVWGYNGFSPTYEQGSPRHIRAWEQASASNNPQDVRNAARGVGGAATGKTFRR
jgi:hypothetical protein